MRVFFLLVFTLSVNFTFSQKNVDINYLDAIQIIKKSDFFFELQKGV